MGEEMSFALGNPQNYLCKYLVMREFQSKIFVRRKK